MDSSKTPPNSRPGFFLRCGRWLFSWRGVRRLLIVGAWLVTIIGLWHALSYWRGRRAWETYQRELAAKGLVFDLQALYPKPISPEENFAGVPEIAAWANPRSEGLIPGGDDFGRVEHLVPGNSMESAGWKFQDLVAWEKAFTEKDPKTKGKLEPGPQDRESRAKAAPAVLEGLKSSEPLLKIIAGAASRPRSRFPIDYRVKDASGILLPHLAKIQGALSRLHLHASAELALGQSDAALKDMNLMLRLADSMKEEPFLISLLLRFHLFRQALHPIWEGLADHQFSDAQLQILEAKLQEYDFIAELKTPLNVDRLMSAQLVGALRGGDQGLFRLDIDLGDGPTASPTFGGPAGRLIPTGWFYMELVNYFRTYQQLLDGAYDAPERRVFPSRIETNQHAVNQRLNALYAPGFPVKALLTHHVLATTCIPALGKLMAKTALAQIMADEAALACALERHRLAHGSFPENLAALAPQFVARLPLDPLTGQSYLYHRNNNGTFVLYSVGWNGKDDGGKPARDYFQPSDGDWVWQFPPAAH